MTIQQLVKRISAAGLKTDFMSLPETEELWHRTPEHLRSYLVRVLYDLREPWRLRGAPAPKTDQDYFEHWRRGRDRDFRDLDPNYVPPPPDGDDDSSDGAGAPPPGP
ncbi:hypothetical protein [uncultured Roseibium sp.]|uniref:hypothetical protein n=1 Tax=uncultured Roseibium sp. TaxID=1936171 RepID=UPI00262360FC|nr:hypothetical protein [uncultured Roseibium sp.]